MIPALARSRVRLVGLALFLGLCAPGVALGGPVEEARQMLADGADLLAKAQKTRSRKKKPTMLADAIKKMARAHMLITSRKLQNDAPDLLADIDKRLDEANALPEVVTMRRDLLKQAIDAAAADKLTEAYDHLASLRDLDPRDRSVEYALRVIGQKMGDN